MFFPGASVILNDGLKGFTKEESLNVLSKFFIRVKKKK